MIMIIVYVNLACTTETSASRLWAMCCARGTTLTYFDPGGCNPSFDLPRTFLFA